MEGVPQRTKSQKAKPRGFFSILSRRLFSFLPFPGLFFSLIWLLRGLTLDPAGTFGPLTLGTVILHQLARLHIAVSQSRLRNLWLDGHFHFLLFLLALLAAETYSLLFCASTTILFLRHCSKTAALKIAPHLPGVAGPVRRAAAAVRKADVLRRFQALLDIAFCPYLMLGMVGRRAVPACMAASVSAMVYLPFAYVVQRGHRFVWKTINIVYTQLAFDCQTAAFGKLLFEVLDRFRDFADLLLAMYPAKFVQRWNREIDMQPR
jgi:hypothetical protein